MFQLYSELFGTPYFTECLHQFTIPSSIYYDDHDPKCLIVLYLAMVFYKTHFRDQTITLRGFLMRVTIKDVAKLAGVARLQLSRASSKQIHD